MGQLVERHSFKPAELAAVSANPNRPNPEISRLEADLAALEIERSRVAPMMPVNTATSQSGRDANNLLR